MPIFKQRTFAVIGLFSLALTACEDSVFRGGSAPTAGIRETPAVRLNFRYEGDVPAPTLDGQSAEDRNAAIQTDFDTNRPQELLDRTLSSPNKKCFAVVYHRVTDAPAEYRLDMYTPDGKLLKKMTSDAMAVHFPETIVWSPDSANIAFVAMLRILTAIPAASPSPATATEPAANSSTAPPTNTNAEPVATETPAAEATPVPVATPPPPTGILTFRTEQIYTGAADGSNVRPLTINEGLIYFYYTWSPDSSMIAALAVTSREWKFMDISSASKGETLIPQGRPRIIEKNGRERRLDDNLTAVRPVWSPDSAKVAAAFGNQIRLYDAVGTSPTQSAAPLRNQLLISSQNYDRQQQQQQAADPNAPAQPTPSADEAATLPDEKLLVSFNPIVELAWTGPELLYLKTAYIRRMRNEADSVTSFARWHRIILSVQAAVAPTR